MSIASRIILPSATAVLTAAALGLGNASQDAAAPPPAKQSAQAVGNDMDELRVYVDELLIELTQTRKEVAELQLENNELRAELNELSQFITDNDNLGRDFEQYKAIRDIAERESKQRELERRQEEARQRAAAKRAERDAARAQARARQAVEDRLNELNNAGFTHIGIDVFSGRMAYHYKSTDNTRSHIEYDPTIGHYPRIYRSSNIDFSEMTISGSIMNASNEVRNIGVAVVFFDNNNNQVGHETVQINNARPDVPYPFTSTINMALNRPFASSSVYVLYADPIAETAD